MNSPSVLNMKKLSVSTYHRNRFGIPILWVMLFVSQIASGQLIELDSTFGQNGIVISNLNCTDYLVRSILQPDGKILLSGTTHEPNQYFDFVVTRYESNGILDSTFNSTGVKTIDFNNEDACTSMLLQPDSKIVLVGRTRGTDFDIALVRLLSDGKLDSTFNGSGKVTTDLYGGSYDWGVSSVLQPNGEIIVAGMNIDSNNSNFALVKYKSNGFIDSSFGNQGLVVTDYNNFDRVKDLVLQPDGKILLGADVYAPNESYLLIRYNQDGSMDSSFGDGGFAITDLNGHSGELMSIALQSDGKILASGDIKAPWPEEINFALVRFNQDGSIDSTFNSNGIFSFHVGYLGGYACDWGFSTDEQADGKILIGGSAFMSLDTRFDFTILRVTHDGALDLNFNSGGVITTMVDSFIDIGYSLLLEQDGKIILSGSANDKFAMARYHEKFNVGIDHIIDDQHLLTSVYPNPVITNTTLQYELAAPEKINLNLCEISGQVIRIFMENEMRSAGVNREELPLAGISPGIYLLRFHSDNFCTTIKLVKL